MPRNADRNAIWMTSERLQGLDVADGRLRPLVYRVGVLPTTTVPFTRVPGVALVFGGLAWALVRPLVMTSWGQRLLGLTYEDFNRLMVVPLGCLLAGGVLALRARLVPDHARLSFAFVALGIALSLAGVVAEFWIGGGLRGNRPLALAGWLLYLVGLLVQTVALLAFAWRSRRLASAFVTGTALGIALLHAAWMPLLIAQLDALSVLDQIVIGVLWAALGLGSLADRPSTAGEPAVSSR